MITTTEQPGTAATLGEEPATSLGPILVATDGTESAEAALRAAAMLATHTGADVTALAVLEGWPLVAADYGILIPPIDPPPARRQSLIQRVRTQLRTLKLDAEHWTIEIREGDPATTIARAARELDARLIVLGLGHHELLDRLFGSETALHTLRLAQTPVLAVPPTFSALPRRAVMATDFTVASIAAARHAFALFDTVEAVTVLHVSPPLELQPDAFAAWMSVFGEGVEPAFARVKAEIGLPESVKVETVTKSGKPSREILEFARSTNADLIVTGSRGAGLVDRILVGSTATGLLRGAECAVFAVPARSGEQRLAWPATGNRVSLESSHWAEELDAFTKRNVGRLASLEIDDPEMGAQAQEHGWPFLGATWDHHDQRVEIMLGDFAGVGRHLTRGIAGVTDIDLLKDETGRDWILRVAYGRGQTLLSLKR
jgi:nucleotide-binding universal stress UspA family protein